MSTRDYVSDEYLIDFADKLDSLSEKDKSQSGITYDIGDPSTGRKRWVCAVGDNVYAANTIRELAEIVVEKWDERTVNDDDTLSLEYI